MTRINKSLSLAQAFVLVGARVIVSVHSYLEQAKNILLNKNNENAEVNISGPRRFARRDDRVPVIFRAKVRFASGHLLDLSDDFLIEPTGEEWTRKFSYFFGETRDGKMERIFLFDTHGVFGSAAHLDLDNEERISTGDPKLNGFVPDNIDIMDVCRYVDLYFANQKFPWILQ
ncbi:MAG: hypothetical protein WB795_00025 [Candidatus Acidiferrales bacterium]